tara:strand:+ start:380 stop:640 length:261 start_codon:yes stop_codon:yes gene_type:complete
VKNYYVPIIFFQLVIITYLSLITVDIRWEIRSGFKTQEKLIAENEELENLNYQLLTEEFFLNSPARIEKKAKEDLGMIKKRPKKTK